ncbi:MAG: ATP-binding protein [Planctomycetes bacterium]|nr:ATP-binding protein [Planctomycetota bacterium]
MHGYIPRDLKAILVRDLGRYPAVAMVGPRQCGKSTLARMLASQHAETIYLDLDLPVDRHKMETDPEEFLRRNAAATVCLDEIQRVPDLFGLLRALVDEDRRPGRFLLLGSASPALLKQGSQTLAGRLAVRELTPLLRHETAQKIALPSLWLRGGFPGSVLAGNDAASLLWREDFVKAFLERELPLLGFRVPAATLERFWRMCAHLHGQEMNLRALGRAMGTSHVASRHHLDILTGTFMLRVLEPLSANLGKRLVRTPRIYLRDAGIVHALLNLETENDLAGHPVRGASWEGFVIEQVLARAEGWRATYYRTAQGAELDLVLEKGLRKIAIECKASSSPAVTRGFWIALKDLGIREAYVAAPIKAPFPMGNGVEAVPLDDLLGRFG